MSEKKPASVEQKAPKSADEKMTHREEIAQKGDYLGRKPGVVTTDTPFDEEALVDEREKGAEPGGETEQSS
jgi:hypothetical protein